MQNIPKKQIASWVMFDFANSAYTTLVLTFIYGTFFVKKMAGDEIYGTALWSRAVTITAICVALLSPFLGAVADRSNTRKSFLFISSVITVAATTVLYFFEPGQILPALIVFIISNIAFELSNVFYNAFLPDLSPSEKIGTISGIGWGVGYAGGLAALIVAMVGFVSPDIPWFNLSRAAGENIRATNLLVAAWFAFFSLPLFLFVKVPSKPPDNPGGRLMSQSLSDLLTTFKQISDYPHLTRLLIARLVYNDGLVTIFAFGGIYAAGTFNFTFHEIMLFGIVINVFAGIGAIAMGFLDDRIGGKTTVQISNIVLALAVLMAVLSDSRTVFWASGILIGLFAGPNQSASRSLLGRFVPEQKENQFFGLFAFSGKLTAFLGPMLLGLFTQWFNSQRAGVFVVVLFFLAGALILSPLNEAEGIKNAGRN